MRDSGDFREVQAGVVSVLHLIARMHVPLLAPRHSFRQLTFRLSLLAWAVSAVGHANAAESAAPDADNGGITLPEGFHATVFADDLGKNRFITVSPSGVVYVKSSDSIIALKDDDGDGRAEIRKNFGPGGGTGIALRGEWLYHSSNDAVYRYRLPAGELVPQGEPETIVRDLPNEKQHEAKSFAFGGDGQLYVEVGSPSNALGNPDRARGAKGRSDIAEFLSTHGGIWRFDPDKLNQTQADGFHYSTGHRHVLSLAWQPTAKSFYITMMGRDQLNIVAPQYYDEEMNAELPAEEFHVLKEGSNFGWPTTYFDPLRKERMLAPEFGGDGKTPAPKGQFPDPIIAFPAHWAPLQTAFYTGQQFPEKYRGGAFIAFQGSWNRAPKPQKGYKVVFVPVDAQGHPTGKYEIFADSFAGPGEILSTARARFRPCGLAFGPDGSLYVSDSQKGRVWRITYSGK